MSQMVCIMLVTGFVQKMRVTKLDKNRLSKIWKIHINYELDGDQAFRLCSNRLYKQLINGIPLILPHRVKCEKYEGKLLP